MRKKNKRTTECDKILSHMILELHNMKMKLSNMRKKLRESPNVTKELSHVILELHNVKMKPLNVKKKIKGTAKCDKRTITCNVRTTQCVDETIKCEKKVMLHIINRLNIPGFNETMARLEDLKGRTRLKADSGDWPNTL